MQDALSIPTLGEHLLSARLRHHTLGQVTWQRIRHTFRQGLVLQGDNSATKVCPGGCKWEAEENEAGEECWDWNMKDFICQV